MAQYTCGMQRKEKWYNKNIFPLVPILEVKERNSGNKRGFVFRWMFITVWDLDIPSFEVSVVADTHWGLGMIGLLPYLRWVIAVPCPEKLSMWIHKNLNRSEF